MPKLIRTASLAALMLGAVLASSTLATAADSPVPVIRAHPAAVILATLSLVSRGLPMIRLSPPEPA